MVQFLSESRRKETSMSNVKFRIGDKIRLKKAYADKFISISIQKIYEIIDVEETIGGIALTLLSDNGVIGSRFTVEHFDLIEDIYTLGEITA